MGTQCPHCGRWDSRATVVDGIIVQDGRVLLIRRGRNPFKGCFAIPGGYMDRDETAEEACKREVLEETGLEGTIEAFLGYYDSPSRDPQRQNVSLVYVVKPHPGEAVAGDDAEEILWADLDHLPDMAFDHQQILEDYRAWRRSQR